MVVLLDFQEKIGVDDSSGNKHLITLLLLSFFAVFQYLWSIFFSHFCSLSQLFKKKKNFISGFHESIFTLIFTFIFLGGRGVRQGLFQRELLNRISEFFNGVFFFYFCLWFFRKISPLPVCAAPHRAKFRCCCSLCLRTQTVPIKPRNHQSEK